MYVVYLDVITTRLYTIIFVCSLYLCIKCHSYFLNSLFLYSVIHPVQLRNEPGPSDQFRTKLREWHSDNFTPPVTIDILTVNKRRDMEIPRVSLVHYPNQDRRFPGPRSVLTLFTSHWTWPVTELQKSIDIVQSMCHDSCETVIPNCTYIRQQHT